MRLGSVDILRRCTEVQEPAFSLEVNYFSYNAPHWFPKKITPDWMLGICMYYVGSRFLPPTSPLVRDTR